MACEIFSGAVRAVGGEGRPRPLAHGVRGQAGLPRGQAAELPDIGNPRQARRYVTCSGLAVENDSQ
ncbi:MAG: hypothetical protein CTR53_12215 [Ferrovibrio sp.]|nr:MAG: hypothetical protein CTR53_12215 [Ferrovibrio sp.]